MGLELIGAQEIWKSVPAGVALNSAGSNARNTFYKNGTFGTNTYNTNSWLEIDGDDADEIIIEGEFTLDNVGTQTLVTQNSLQVGCAFLHKGSILAEPPIVRDSRVTPISWADSLKYCKGNILGVVGVNGGGLAAAYNMSVFETNLEHYASVVKNGVIYHTNAGAAVTPLDGDSQTFTLRLFDPKNCLTNNPINSHISTPSYDIGHIGKIFLEMTMYTELTAGGGAAADVIGSIHALKYKRTYPKGI